MSHQPQLQIYNIIRESNAESVFHLFPILPTELRLKIWQDAIQRPRLIHVRVHPTKDQDEEAKNDKTGKYRVVINNRSMLSNLLHVSHESREAALRFYRVHIPCEFRVDLEIMRGQAKRGTFYFNPEYDILKIGVSSPAQDTLLEFLHQLKHTYDPQRVGLLNLAIDCNDFNACDLNMLGPADENISFEVRRSFIETLARLHEVFFVAITRVGRQIVGLSSGLPTSDTIFNRSFPILSTSMTAFNRLPRDPRAIADDLKHVFVGTFDPRDMFDSWGRLLNRWTVSPSHHISYRFLLAFTPIGNYDKVCNRENAERWLQHEDRVWKGEPNPEDSDRPIAAFFQSFREMKRLWPVGANHPKYQNEDMETAVKPAFGFWLFPLEGLGAVSVTAGGNGLGVDLIQPEGYRSEPKRLLDLTSHWPELALFDL